MDRRPMGSGGFAAGYKYATVDGARKFEHVRIAEEILGKPLPADAVVHHIDGDKANNDPSNLVICPDQRYHILLHTRQRALDACGNANWRKCPYCKEYDDPASMSSKPHRAGVQFRHLACVNRYNVALLARKKGNQSSIHS